MVIPLGDRFTQVIHLVIKRDGKLIDKELKPTLFVPMTGKALKEGPEPKAVPDEPGGEQPKGGRGRGRSTKSQSKASAKGSL